MARPTPCSSGRTSNSKGPDGDMGSSPAVLDRSQVFSPVVRSSMVFCSEVCIRNVVDTGYCNWLNQFIANLFLKLFAFGVRTHSILLPLSKIRRFVMLDKSAWRSEEHTSELQSPC